jgi:hypothetical protein
MALAILTFVILILLCLAAVLFFGSIASETFRQKKMIIRNHDQDIILDG